MCKYTSLYFTLRELLLVKDLSADIMLCRPVCKAQLFKCVTYVFSVRSLSQRVLMLL